MKKIFCLFIMIFALCLTGCGEKTTRCTSDEKDDFVNYEYEIYSNGDKVTKIVEKVTYEFDSEEDAKEAIDGEKPEFDTDDIKFSRDGKVVTAVATYKVEKDDEVTSKKELIDSIESGGYTCK